MEQRHLKELLDKYIAGNISDEELAEIETWYEHFDEQPSQVEDLNTTQRHAHEERMLRRINVALFESAQPVYRLWPRIAAAASILLACAVGGYFILHQKDVSQIAVVTQHDILPGGNKAILTLANGKHIDITSAKSGILAQDHEASIAKTSDGQLTYRSDKNVKTEIAYNTLSTPVGGRYALTLSDGTKVILDAQSSISYPVAFGKSERKVKVTGQAYFEVVHDAAHPFSVQTEHTLIKDIGTSFNVNSYPDEEGVKTTLIEGIIAVNNHQLIPGQQALTNGTATTIKQADVESVTAWKENKFLFRGQSLHTTMQQIARWYDVEVVYEVNPEAIRVGGKISRQLNLSAVLDMIQGTGLVHCSVEGRKIIITK